MKTILISILILSFFASCDPCKKIAKYERCFPADTVKQIEYKTKYIKEVVTNDSIVFEQIPCDPKTNTVYDTKTVYKTNWKTIIDTIYSNKEVIKVNPVNDVLKSNNEKLEKQTKFRGKVILYESILLFIIAALVFIKIKSYI